MNQFFSNHTVVFGWSPYRGTKSTVTQLCNKWKCERIKTFLLYKGSSRISWKIHVLLKKKFNVIVPDYYSSKLYFLERMLQEDVSLLYWWNLLPFYFEICWLDSSPIVWHLCFWAVSCNYTDKSVLVAPHYTQENAGWIDFYFAWFTLGIGRDI